MNFMKPNSATIRYTNSQWPRRDCSEVPVGKIAVPKTVQKSRSLRRDASDVLLSLVAVPKGR